MLTLRLSHEVESRLSHLAKMTGRTKSFYAKKAIMDCIEDMEDTFLVLHRIDNSEKTYTMKEVEKMIGLGD